jgi:hypothetical protein
LALLAADSNADFRVEDCKEKEKYFYSNVVSKSSTFLVVSKKKFLKKFQKIFPKKLPKKYSKNVFKQLCWLWTPIMCWYIFLVLALFFLV